MESTDSQADAKHVREDGDDDIDIDVDATGEQPSTAVKPKSRGSKPPDFSGSGSH